MLICYPLFIVVFVHHRYFVVLYSTVLSLGEAAILNGLYPCGTCKAQVPWEDKGSCVKTVKPGFISIVKI